MKDDEPSYTINNKRKQALKEKVLSFFLLSLYFWSKLITLYTSSWPVTGTVEWAHNNNNNNCWSKLITLYTFSWPVTGTVEWAHNNNNNNCWGPLLFVVVQLMFYWSFAAATASMYTQARVSRNRWMKMYIFRRITSSKKNTQQQTVVCFFYSNLDSLLTYRILRIMPHCVGMCSL